jgi:branched-chain amino acid transport system substrate-binding protein
MRNIHYATLVVGACAALALSACSSGSKGGGGATAAGSGSSTSSATPTGTPIVLGAVSPVTGTNSVPTYELGIKAAVAYMNSQGGVNGHPIKVDYCDDDGQDASKNAACVRSFVTDNVTAILNYGSAIATSLPIAVAAGIPVITPGSTAPETSSKYTIIPLETDALSGYAAMFQYAKSKGKTSVSSLVINIPAVYAPYGKLLAGAAAKAGLKFVREVAVDPTATDFTPQVLKAADGADFITMSYGPAGMAQTLKDAQSNGLNVEFGGSNTLVDEKNFLTPAGAAANGSLAYSGVLLYSSDDAQAKTFRDQMTKAGLGANIDGVSELGFSYAMTSYTALKGMTDYTPQAFLSYFSTNKVPVFLGQTYDATNVPFPNSPAVHVTSARIFEVQNGKFADVGGGWVNAYGS